MHQRLLAFLTAWLLVGGLCASYFQATALAEQAQSAEVFADSICVNTHFSYTNTPYYTNQSYVIQLLVDAGIRNVRDVVSGGVGAMLAAEGIKTNYLLSSLPWQADSNINTTYQLIQTLKGLIGQGMLIDAILGVNEPDLFWADWNVTYNGKGFPNGTVDYIRDMYTLLRQDASFDDKWIIGAPLANRGVLPTNCCSQWVDFGDMHPYPFNGNYLANPFPYDNITLYFQHSNQPTVNVDQFPKPWVQAKAYYPDRPWFASETGYSTEIVGVGTSIRAHGFYINRLFAEYFRLGIRRTCVYEFLNEFNNATDHESNFGLVFFNYTAKPGYTALKNLMALVRSDWAPSSSQLRPPTYSLSTLEFSLNVSPVGSFNRTDYVHHLLLEKPNGVLLLLLWHEISDEDTSTEPHRQVYPPSMPTVVTLPPNYIASLYAPNEGPGLSSTYSTDGLSTFAGATSISLVVPDHVIVLRLVATSDGSTLCSQAGAIGLWRSLPTLLPTICVFGLCVF